MSNIFIYLAGPITGETGEEANGWREVVTENLLRRSSNFIGVSPLRCEPPQDNGSYPRYDEYSSDLAAAIAAKNLLDVRRCDLLFAYLPKESIGTLQEIGWAVGMGKPVIVLSGLEEILSNPIIAATVPFRFRSGKGGLFTALDTIEGLFGVYT